MKTKVIVDQAGYGKLRVESGDCVVSILTKTEIDAVGETDFALYPSESKKLRKALKKAERYIAKCNG